MNSGHPDPQGGRPEDSREKWITIDRMCDAYEASLQEGAVERGAYLAGVPSEWREQLTAELDAIDDSYRQATATREKTIEADSDEFCHRRLPKKRSLEELAELDSDRVWLGRFEIRQRLGTGATGSVWCARDARLARWVALKVPHPSRVMSETAAGRFQTEARASAAITHPNVVQVHEVLIEEGLPVLVQQWIDGPSLAEYLKDKGSMEFDRAADWMSQIADAVACAHAEGIVHRDLKPANVMLNQDRPMVLDFGLASYPQLSSGLTTEGAVLGTPAYMSPEQAEGAENATEPATDIYALGAMLYEMLVGTPPFVGTAREVLHACKHQMPVPPRNRRSAIPRDLETIVLRCLAKSPGLRYQSAEDVRDDLKRFRKREPIQARKVSFIETAFAWCRLHPVHALLAAGIPLVLFLLIGMVVSQWRQSQLTDRANTLEQENKESESERYQLLMQRQMIELSRASSELAEGDRTRGLALLGAVPEAMRGWEWHLLDRLSNTPAVAINQDLPVDQRDVPYSSLTRAPRRHRLFAATQGGSIIQWKLPPDRVMFLSEPGEQKAAYSSEVLFHSSLAISAMSVSPDEKWLSWIDEEGGVAIWDLEENELKQRLTGEENRPGYALAFSPDSKCLAVGGGSPGLGESEPNSGSWLMACVLDDHGAFEPTWNRTWETRDAITSLCFTAPSTLYCSRGREVSKPGSMGYVERWDCDNGELEYGVQVWRGQGMRGLDYDENSQRLAWCDLTGMVYLKSVLEPVSLAPLQFRVGIGAATQVRFSPDGEQLIVSANDGGVSCWAVPFEAEETVTVAIEPASEFSKLGASADIESDLSETETSAPVVTDRMAGAKVSLSSEDRQDQPSASRSIDDPLLGESFGSLDGSVDSSGQQVSRNPPPASGSNGSDPPVSPAKISSSANRVKHLRDYRGHSFTVRDALFVWPGQLSGNRAIQNRLKRTAPFLLTCGDDGKVLQWSNGEREGVTSVRVGERTLVDAQWVSDHQLVAMTGASKRVVDPITRKYSFPRQPVSADVRRVRSGRFLAVPTRGRADTDEPAVFVLGCKRVLEFMRVGSGKRLTRRTLPQESKGWFTAACWCNARFLVAAVNEPAPAEVTDGEEDGADKPTPHQSSLWIYDTQREAEPLKLVLPLIGSVQRLVLSPDQQFLFGCSSQGAAFWVRLPAWPDQAFTWDSAIVHTWTAHRRAVFDFAWINQQRFSTVGEDGNYAIWDWNRRTRVGSAARSDGSAPAVREGDSSVAIPELRYQVQVSSSPLRHVTCTSDGSRLATVGDDGVIRIWDTPSGLELISFPPRNSRVSSLRFSADDGYLMIADASGRVQLVRLRAETDSATVQGSASTEVAEALSQGESG